MKIFHNMSSQFCYQMSFRIFSEFLSRVLETFQIFLSSILVHFIKDEVIECISKSS